MKQDVIEAAYQGGEVLRHYFGNVRQIRTKESPSSVVTEADLEAEKRILALIRQRHPAANIVAEETGFEDRGSRYTWVIDPLDGTSNYAAGLPWFGVMVSVLEDGQPIVAAMYLPLDDQLYYAERGHGTYRGLERVRVTTETSLSNVLLAHGMDGQAQLSPVTRQGQLHARLAQAARNVRATNCLLDFLYTIDGRFGGCVNHNTRIWDIAAPTLLMAEAGGRLTYLDGSEISFDLGPACSQRVYAVAAASPSLLPQLVALAAESGAPSPSN